MRVERQGNNSKPRWGILLKLEASCSINLRNNLDDMPRAYKFLLRLKLMFFLLAVLVLSVVTIEVTTRSCQLQTSDQSTKYLVPTGVLNILRVCVKGECLDLASE